MLSLLGWYLVVLVLGWVAYPIAFVALKNLPDKGYVFSKVLALVLVGYFSWILGYFSFNGGTILLSFFFFASLSAALFFSLIGRPFFGFFLKKISFFFFVVCFFFLAFFVAWAP